MISYKHGAFLYNMVCIFSNKNTKNSCSWLFIFQNVIPMWCFDLWAFPSAFYCLYFSMCSWSHLYVHIMIVWHFWNPSWSHTKKKRTLCEKYPPYGTQMTNRQTDGQNWIRIHMVTMCSLPTMQPLNTGFPFWILSKNCSFGEKLLLWDKNQEWKAWVQGYTMHAQSVQCATTLIVTFTLQVSLTGNGTLSLQSTVWRS